MINAILSFRTYIVVKLRAFWQWQYRNVVLYCIAGLITIGIVLYAADRISGYKRARGIDRMKANVNVALKDITDAQANINALKPIEQQALNNVNIATREYLDAVNATDQQRRETDIAKDYMTNAAVANKNVNISVRELERKLQEAGQ